MNPRFSIITITFNAANVLPPTMQSVADQTFTDYEYIIMDGASTDNTLKVARESGKMIKSLRIFSKKDAGIYYGMNNALEVAAGDYLIFLNAGDCFADSNALQTIADTAAATGADIVYGQTRLVDEQRKVLGMRHLTAPDHLTMKDFANGMLVCHQAFVARRTIAPDYDTRYRFSADYDWCLRCLSESKLNAYTGTVLIDYLTGGTTDKNHQASLKERFSIMCRYFGTVPTVMRHIKFAIRAFLRKIKG